MFNPTVEYDNSINEGSTFPKIMEAFGRNLDPKWCMDSHLFPHYEDTIRVNLNLEGIKGINDNHKDFKQSLWRRNFSLSYGIYNHNPKGYEWTNLMGGYLNNVNKWDHKETYSLETIFFIHLTGNIWTLSSLKDEGHVPERCLD